MHATPLCLILTLLAAAPGGHAGASVLAAKADSTAPTKKAPKKVASASGKSSVKVASKKGTSSARPKAPSGSASAKKAAKAAKATAKAKPTAKAASKASATRKAAASARNTPSKKAAARPQASASRKAAPAASSELSRARELLRAVKKDPERRRYKHEWEKAIRALERAAKGRARAPALLDAARARYALYRFSSDEADRDRALALAAKAQKAGAADARTFIAAVRREAGDDEPAARASKVARGGKGAAKPSAPAAARGSGEPSAPPPPAAPDEGGDDPPDTDPVLDKILAQLAEDPDAALESMLPAGAAIADASRPVPAILEPPAVRASPAARAFAGAVADPLAAAPGAASIGAPAGTARAAHPADPAVPAPVPRPPPAPATAGAAPAARVEAPAKPRGDDVLSSIIADLPDAAAPAAEEAPSGPIRRIVIDPGHGGHDSGAVGPSRLQEKDVVLAISKRLARRLRDEGYEVVLTRDDDRYLALAERTAIANANRGDLFVSIHANAHPRRDRQGVETWVLDVNSDRYSRRLAARENGIVDDADSPLDVRRILADLDAKVSARASRRLASVVQRELTAGIRQQFGPVKDLGVKSALFYVLLGARMPAVLVETSFISNRAEEKRLKSGKFQDEVASSLARAIGTFAAQQSRIAAR